MRCVFIARTTGNHLCDAMSQGPNVTTLAPASFEIERFERADEACIEVRGRWSGVRGRRFMRPTLTAVSGGREQRILAVLDHKPWLAEEGEVWQAAFPCAADPASLRDAELTVAPDVTVPLTARSAATSASAPAGRTGPIRSPRSAAPERSTTAEAGDASHLARLERQCQRLRAERDGARAARDLTARERDAASADRDGVVHERNRMLAERDTAQTRIEEVARQWELTAALGTRRTLERDTAANERDAVANQRDRLACDRDAALEERDRVACDLAAALEEHAGTIEERDAALAELDSAASTATLALNRADDAASALGQTEEMIDWRPLVASEQELVSHDPRSRLGDGAASRVWRARVLSVCALLLAALVLLVLVLAK
jgi:hypothetical protein